jgi:hypothetical protein
LRAPESRVTNPGLPLRGGAPGVHADRAGRGDEDRLRILLKGRSLGTTPVKAKPLRSGRPSTTLRIE